MLIQALAPFTIGRNQVTASLLGALWGFGHSAGQLFMGLLMIILKVGFHCMNISLWVFCDLCQLSRQLMLPNAVFISSMQTCPVHNAATYTLLSTLPLWPPICHVAA